MLRQDKGDEGEVMPLLPDDMPEYTRPKLTEEQLVAIEKTLGQMVEILEGTGAHADHERKQIGRCVYCSCGMRVQGEMNK